jgi:hypothetical protein
MKSIVYFSIALAECQRDFSVGFPFKSRFNFRALFFRRRGRKFEISTVKCGFDCWEGFGEWKIDFEVAGGL